MTAGGVAAFVARQHPGHLLDAVVARDRLGAGRRRAPATRLVTTTCVVAWAATWARWVTTSTWWWPASSASARPTAVAAVPPMPASTSSNTSVRAASPLRRACPSAALSTRRRASIDRASSPPDATFVSGCSGEPGLAASRNCTRSPGSSSGRRRPGRPPWHEGGPGPRRRSVTAAARRGAAGSTGGTDRRGRRPLGAQRRRPVGIEGRRPLLEALELGQPVGGAAPVADHLGEVVAVLATEVVEQLAAPAHLLQPLRVLLDALGRATHVGADVVELGQHGRQAIGDVAERRPAADRGQRRGQRVTGRRRPRPARRGTRRRPPGGRPRRQGGPPPRPTAGPRRAPSRAAAASSATW